MSKLWYGSVITLSYHSFIGGFGTTTHDITSVYVIGNKLGADKQSVNTSGELLDESIFGLLTVPIQMYLGGVELHHIETIAITNNEGGYLVWSYSINDQQYEQHKFREVHITALVPSNQNYSILVEGRTTDGYVTLGQLYGEEWSFPIPLYNGFMIEPSDQR